jgi:hypothetical protein
MVRSMPYHPHWDACSGDGFMAGRGRRSEASRVDAFFAQLPAARRQRMQAIRRTLLRPGIREAVVEGALLLENGSARVRVASLIRHIGIYFPAPALLEGVRARHPELRCGRRSVSIRDDQYLPLYELQCAALRTFLPQDRWSRTQGPSLRRRGEFLDVK